MINLASDAGEFESYQQTQKQAVEKTKTAFSRIASQINDMNHKIKNVKDTIQDVDGVNEHLKEKLNEISIISEEAVATAQQVTASSETQAQSIEQVSESALRLQGISQELSAEVAQFVLSEHNLVNNHGELSQHIESTDIQLSDTNNENSLDEENLVAADNDSKAI